MSEQSPSQSAPGAIQNPPETVQTPAPLAVAVAAAPPPVVLPDRPFNEATASLVELKEVARLMAASSQFKDVQANNPATAFAKMMVGRDLGIPMTRALVDVLIIQGKPTLSANLMAAMIKKSGRYKYKKLAHTDQECRIQVWEKVDGVWEDLGVSEFTLKDAEKAGLLKNPTWKNFPKNMLFSRVISNIAKQECGDVFLGSVYTPDELDASIEVDEGGDPVLPKAQVTRVRNNAAQEAPAYVPECPSPKFTTREKDMEVTDAEIIEAPAGEETVHTVAAEVEALAAQTAWDLKGFLKQHRLTRLTSLDLTSLKNTRNNLRQRKLAGAAGS
jgi:hypothetical protein